MPLASSFVKPAPGRTITSTNLKHDLNLGADERDLIAASHDIWTALLNEIDALVSDMRDRDSARADDSADTAHAGCTAFS